MKVRFADVELAHEFISAGMQFENAAYVCRKTGKVYWVGDCVDPDEEIPEDIGESDAYVSIPHKNELALGTTLVHQFTAELAPELCDEVRRIFKSKGGYSRYKSLLAKNKLLERWHRYEEDAETAALKQWCAEQGIELTDED